ncbi:MAG: hypothetical protein M3463_07330 [Verrucomicrobiota bacterium]|nr:hypothetical protein [Verrucomicrobiota bacterium]
MSKLHRTLCALGILSLASAYAQQPQVPAEPAAPVLDAPAPEAPAAATPAPIEPPIAVPGAPQETSAPVVIDPAVPPGTPTSAPVYDPSAARVFEFQKDEIGLVLRTLARQARMNIVISEKVPVVGGTVETRLEGMTARQALETIVVSKGLIMDELNGVYFIKTQEEKAKEPTESSHYTLSYAMAKEIAPLLQGQLQSGVAPQIDIRTNTVFFRESRSNLDKITSFLDGVDRPTRQVMIEARLVEVTANPIQSYGINWAGTLGSSTTPQTFRYGGSGSISPGDPGTSIIVNPDTGTIRPFDFALNGLSSGGFGDLLGGQFAILSVPQLSATLRLLNEDRDAEFLANPRVVTANNLKADIRIIRQQPVPQLNFNEQTAQAVFSGFQDKEFGNTLEVTPSINKDDFISLLVKPEISNKVGDQFFTFGGATVSSPIIDKRSLISNVVIKSGDTLAIGGLLQDEVIKGRTKVPFLGDIPIVGYLFQEKLNSRTKRNLLVFVTPTIIKQGYGTGLEEQVSGLNHSGEEFADPNGWRNNARGAGRLVPTSHRQVAADYPKPGVAKAPRSLGYKVNARAREK